tara:strand:+ start:16619 stop:17194 length:576 start_codon:yes stop_codon:yes gene_type:complete
MALIGGMLAQAALAEQDRRFRQNQFDKQMDLRERQLSQQDDQFNKSLSLQRSQMAPMMYAFNRAKQDDIILDRLADKARTDSFAQDEYQKALEQYNLNRPMTLFGLSTEDMPEMFKYETINPRPEGINFADPNLYRGLSFQGQSQADALVDAYSANPARFASTKDLVKQSRLISNEMLFNDLEGARNKTFK